jgi:hypothetical protein
MDKDKINSLKEAIKSFTKPYGFESELKRAMELNSQYLLSQTDSIKSAIESFTIPHGFDNELKSVMESLNGSVLTQAMELNSQYLLSQTDSIKSAIESFTIPHGFDSELKSAMETLNGGILTQSIGINHQDLLSNFKDLNLSELISLHNELNHTLKPYDSDCDIPTSGISWIDLKEVINYLAAIITIYMYWVYLSTSPLDKKDLDKMFIKQQFQLQEEFKKQNKQISNLVELKNKDLYYLTVRDNIVLRTNPYIKKSTAKARLDKDAQLLVLLRKDNWLNVEYFDEDNQITQVGWVNIKNLKRVRKY